MWGYLCCTLCQVADINMFECAQACVLTHLDSREGCSANVGAGLFGRTYPAQSRGCAVSSVVLAAAAVAAVGPTCAPLVLSESGPYALRLTWTCALVQVALSYQRCQSSATEWATLLSVRLTGIVRKFQRTAWLVCVGVLF